MIELRTKKDPSAPSGPPRLPPRPNGVGMGWNIDPNGNDIAGAMIAIGKGMRSALTLEEIRSLGPKVLLTFDLTQGSGYFSAEIIDREAN